MKNRLRLDRLLANLGYGSRREVQGLLSRGLVELDGTPLKKGDQIILVEEDLPTRLKVRGEELDPLTGLHLIMNKPLAYTCSHKEKGEVVYDLLPERWKARNPVLATVGRLDKDTTGLLLLTDDGNLLHRITSPKKAIAKRYHAKLARPLDGKEAALFASGDLVLEGDEKALMPAELEVLGPQEAILTIREGRYHQVRRMFAAAGNHVETLHRLSIGSLSLPDDLAPGDFRVVTAAELEKVFE
ncbi:MAG: 16S rRNA pseudouridine(516) synthase [Proteobacteria bacterium]|nr:MAG: 16S rRNA pseudouridine(516) synthase [Pseudomonadota bacterium]